MKNKIIKICSLLGSVTGLFFLFFFLFETYPVYASAIITPLTISAGNMSLPAHTTNSIIVCTYHTGTAALPYINGTTAIPIIAPAISYMFPTYIQYIVAPDTVGDITIEYADTCTLIDGVDTTDPITFQSEGGNMGAYSGQTLPYSTGVNGNVLFNFFISDITSGGSSYITWYTSGWAEIWHTSINDYHPSDFIFTYKEVNGTDDLVYTANTSNYGSSWIEFNVPSGPPDCISYTYSDWESCINGQQERRITGKTPSDCDVNNPGSLSVWPEGGWFRECNPYLNIYLPYIWKGILYYTQDTFQMFRYVYNTASISDTDYLEMFKCTNTDCTTGSAVTFNNGATTTTQIGITHPFDIVADTYASGTSMFIIAQPTDLGTTTSQVIKYRINLYQSDVLTQTELRTINWLTQTDYGIVEDDIIPYMECDEPSYSIATICDGIATSTVGDIMCGFKYAIVASGQFLFYPSCESINLISQSYNEFKHAFPFNTYFDLTTTINKAIDTSLATTTSQNFSIPFIRKLATTSEIYMLPVLSSTTISNTIGVTNYATMKLTFGFIWWLLSALIVFFIVTKL